MPAKEPVAFVLGTRPEIVKLSPVIRLFQKEKRPFYLVHTGQHYSYEMDALFFKELALPEPDFKFTRPEAIGANRHEELVGLMQSNISGALKQRPPSAVLVQGDTDSVLAGARAAKQLGSILIGHVEAGLRSYDNTMPEERNRIEADGLSDLLFAPTEAARDTLLKEKFAESRIVVTGNTIVDALFQNAELAEKSAASQLPPRYALVTLHRPETVDNRDRMLSVLKALESLRKKLDAAIVFPIHPRTQQRLESYGISMASLADAGIRTPKPMGFLEFIRHEKNAALILTDSGGVQEEACVLKVPCVTIRTSTERPETVAVGANVVARYDTQNIVMQAVLMASRERSWPNPFGDGKASERIAAALDRCLQ